MLKSMLVAGSTLLDKKKREIDALNVFPVPDGDTGTNMHLTFRAAAVAAEKVTQKSIHEVAGAASMGSLMGARGNSGVILSQIMRGFAKGLEGLKDANALQVANALQMGVETAYRAVMKPVEGTILTVSKETARGAAVKAKSGDPDILEVLRAGYEKGQIALAKTPDMLPVLKQAGVVDAGGEGFLTIIDSWIRALENKESVDLKIPEQVAQKVTEDSTVGISIVEELEFPYCTEFLVKGNNLVTDKIIEDLSDKGDSLLVVGTDEVVKIHVHTQNPGLILNYAIQYGSLHEIQISNMQSQNERAAHNNKEEILTQENLEQPLDSQETIPEVVPETVEEPFKDHGIVAVAMGDGIAEIFKSLGVDEIVYGGQTMNPSTNDLAEAARKVRANNVYILPNNSNIIMAANQVNVLVDESQVHVISTKSIPQAIAALLSFNPDLNHEENVQNMTGSIKQVTSGEVTYAVRNSQFGEIEITEGDILGLVEGEITTTARDIFEVAQKVLETMNWRDKDIITIFYGKDMAEEDVKLLQDWLEKEKPDIEVEVYPGKQPLYYYILGVE
ncbi:MAG: dihydroxyacetone kinase [Gracilibacter sp. BRH_c7a]|nr:MAG: dihydroxyacetone kinase [Gracilibacter sp. BRH_c7a]